MDVQTARMAFADLWDSLHKKPGERWESNPFVFRYGLKKLTREEAHD
ncbi:MAG: hypothetical protein PHY29_02845 [Syntrophales bacterium]|nr:hypothetical protein [Syntrophales bacterium]